MSESISWSMSAQAVGGHKVAQANKLDVDAVCKVHMLIPAECENQEIPLALKEGALRLVIISAEVRKQQGDPPDFVGAPLQFKINDGPDWLTLDMPFMLMGGAVTLLGGGKPLTLWVRNSNAAHEILFEALIGSTNPPCGPAA